MGDWYEVKELAGVYYIEYQSEASGWNPIAVELTNEQAFQVEEFIDKQANEKHEFMKALIASMKAE